MTRIADNRTTIASTSDADAAMGRLAVLEASIAMAEARAEKRIAEIKQLLQEQTAEAVAKAERERSELSAFILSHQDEFVEPRKRKCPHGTYGLQTSTEVIIANDSAFCDWARDNGHDDLFKIIEKPMLPAIGKRLRDGDKLPHCSLRSGDTVVCTVDSKIILAAREQGRV